MTTLDLFADLHRLDRLATLELRSEKMTEVRHVCDFPFVNEWQCEIQKIKSLYLVAGRKG
jgi:hypothetical protein